MIPPLGCAAVPLPKKTLTMESRPTWPATVADPGAVATDAARVTETVPVSPAGLVARFALAACLTAPADATGLSVSSLEPDADTVLAARARGPACDDFE